MIIPIKISKKDYIFNIFIYYPYIISSTIKRICNKKIFNKKIFKVFFINFINIIIYGFPRVVMNYAYIATRIIISYKKNPEKDLKSIISLFMYIYENTFEKYIKNIENFLKYPI